MLVNKEFPGLSVNRILNFAEGPPISGMGCKIARNTQWIYEKQGYASWDVAHKVHFAVEMKSRQYD